MKLFIFILTILCIGQKLAMGQPSLPKMDREMIWIHPNPLEVSGYQLIFGTNVVNVIGRSNTAATIKLAEGVNTIIIRAAGTNGIYSDPFTNVVRLINYEFQESTNGIWFTRTNFTYAIGDYKPSAMFRAKLNWLAQ